MLEILKNADFSGHVLSCRAGGFSLVEYFATSRKLVLYTSGQCHAMFTGVSEEAAQEFSRFLPMAGEGISFSRAMEGFFWSDSLWRSRFADPFSGDFITLVGQEGVRASISIGEDACDGVEGSYLTNDLYLGIPELRISCRLFGTDLMREIESALLSCGWQKTSDSLGWRIFSPERPKNVRWVALRYL